MSLQNYSVIRKGLIAAAGALIFGCCLLFQSPAFAASELTIRNDSESGIINILVRPVTDKRQPFFLRLDLLPGSMDKVENPDLKAILRADTGLQLWTYPATDLAALKALVFCGEHTACLLEEYKDGAAKHIKADIRDLAPQKGSRPVCNLDSFRPAMPMKEVCSILPDHLLTDDNGAILTGLGFANMVWAARMVPEQSGEITDKSLLEHLDLRLPLTKEHVDKLLAELFEQGFLPWQAEFPGRDMEFDAVAPKRQANEKEKLQKQTAAFMEAYRPVKHKNHAKGERCEQASILMAPARMIPALKNADEPASDVQIFTIYLRPCTDTLLLDVTAYRAQPNGH